MSIKSLYPDIRPSLNLNFANSRALDGRITFTRNSVGTYVGANGLIKTAVANHPRFDHDPVTGESLGLLIEEQRTNQFPYSSNISGSGGWNALNLTLTANQTIAPDGTNTASKVGKDSAATEVVYFNDDTSVTSGNVYTQSIFVKASEINYFQITPSTGFPTGHQNFDLVNGVLGTNDGTIVDASITPYPNGWYRCSLTVTSNTSGTGRMVMGPAESASAGRLDSVSGSIGDGIYVWGAQLEVGAFPTSYIPTSGSTVTRIVDVASMTGTNFSSWYNQTEGTIFSQHRLIDGVNNNNNCYIYQVDNGTNNDVAFRLIDKNTAYSDPSKLTATTLTSASSVAVFQKSSASSGTTLHSTSYAVKTNDFAVTFDGATVQTDDSGTLPSNQTTLSIGYNSPANTAQLNGHIKQLTYYPKRLTNAQLQLLTQ